MEYNLKMALTIVAGSYAVILICSIVAITN
ncbi:cytochrome bd-I oxidase subunit CydH [Vibrio algarum]|uniref:YnhF family membrane protein n=1 Tax=Vibrio algarum TaxID=3020714 RepID=A0ABT4YSM4_9VIBR|nr:YnhF family membrane protein [Vibrio sp. KJ40-1]MDB1124395.1 YnhF family membrane protein [Vibrio sp. KJ40-1]